MKKTIAAAVLISASSALALPVYNPSAPRPVVHTYCFNTGYTYDDGSLMAGTCDESKNNAEDQLPLMKNGCAEGQIAYSTTQTLVIRACSPSGPTQL